ncbi:hypothetical protein FOL46_002357, partial [Perkinsus olseni]
MFAAIQLLMVFTRVVAEKCNDRYENQMPFILQKPSNCFTKAYSNPVGLLSNPGPPYSCLFIRKNSTVVNAGLLFLPNTPSPPQIPCNQELFVVYSPSSVIPLDVGIWGEGRTLYDVDLPL